MTKSIEDEFIKKKTIAQLIAAMHFQSCKE